MHQISHSTACRRDRSIGVGEWAGGITAHTATVAPPPLSFQGEAPRGIVCYRREATKAEAPDSGEVRTRGSLPAPEAMDA